MRKYIIGAYLIILIFTSFTGISLNNDQDTLRFGVIKYKSLEDFKNTYGPFVEYIAKKCDKVPVFKIVSDTLLGYQLNNNEYDIGIFKPFPYLEAKAAFPQLEVFASHIAFGSEKYTGVFVVQKISGIQDLHDLHGKKLLFVKGTSTSGYRIPKSILLEHGIDLDSLESYDFSGSHDSSLHSLLMGNVDAIAINKITLPSINYLDSNGLDDLEDFEVPYNAYVFSPGLDSMTKNEIKYIMFHAHLDPYANIFNNKLGIEKWYECTDDNYNQLRRHLRQGRNKPMVKVKIDPTQRTTNYLEGEGDILYSFYTNLIDVLALTNRFTILKEESSVNPDFNISIDISIINIDSGVLHVKTRKNDKTINNTYANIDEIRDKLPKIITDEILINTPIITELHRSKNEWFITYGLSDGIDAKSYRFTINLKDENAMTLSEEDITVVKEFNTYFNDNNKFQKFDEVEIRYFSNSIEDPDGDGILSPNDNCPETYNPNQADKNNDGVGDVCDKPDCDNNPICWIWEWIKKNPWDKLGFLLAIIIVAGGFYFTLRKKRRFRNMLYQTNDLLKNYIEGKYKIDNQVIEQKERINRSLESGRINENQFLILTHRIEEIETIIENRLTDIKGLSPEIEKEIDKILKDGIITEKEYSKLMLILNQKKKKS